MKTIEWDYGSPIDAGSVDAFEREFGVALPRSLKDIALLNDGAVPHPACVAFADASRSTGYDIVGIGQLYRFEGKAGSGWSMAEANRAYGGDFPGLTFFSEAANGWGFALDYRADPVDPPVVIVRFGVDDGEAVVRIASSFDAMLESVMDDDERPQIAPSA